MEVVVEVVEEEAERLVVRNRAPPEVEAEHWEKEREEMVKE